MTSETPSHLPHDMSGVAVRIKQVSKAFGSTRALDAVDLEVLRGEIHALVGGNGSGKSTLIKILAGVYTPDGGTIETSGRMQFVHQDAGVFPELSVLENLAIGQGFATTRFGAVRWREMRRRARRVLERFEIPVDPQTRVSDLGPALRMMIAIARALQDANEDADTLVLDEPTAALPAHEVDVLMDAVRGYARAGHTVIFVSHRLDEVRALADRVSALRDGRLVATVDAATLTEQRLIELVIGRELERVYPELSAGAGVGECLIDVNDLHVGPLRGVSFNVRRREVVGIAGLLGSGRSELLQTIFGALRPVKGVMTLDGSALAASCPRDAMDVDIALVPEDRPNAATFADLSVQDNVSAAQVDRYWRWLKLDRGRERAEARKSLKEFLIKAPSLQAPLSVLSGGNQQKVILARWLRRRPLLLLLDEPTQGVDIGARAEIYQLVHEAVTGGAGAIVVSSDFEELAHVCDRVLILADGRIVAQVTGDELDPHRLTELAYTSTERIE
jgi:ribose transport system ATP-binding protein